MKCLKTNKDVIKNKAACKTQSQTTPSLWLFTKHLH